MIEAIVKYDKREDREAKFVYALDKIITPMNIYLDKGRSWFNDGVTLDMVKTKKDKISISEELVPIWDELVKVIEEVKDEYFPS